MNVFTLRRIGAGITRLQYVQFTKPKFIKMLMYKLVARKKYEKLMEDTYDSFAEYCQRLVKEGKEPSSRVLLEPAQKE